MARNGSGTFSLAAGNPVTTGTTVQSTWANNTLGDIASAITASIANDGQTPVLANLPMSGYKHTGVAVGAALTEYARYDQVQNSAPQYLTAVSGADTITANAPVTPAAYVAGQTFRFVSAGANTTAATLNISGLGAKALTKGGATALVAGDIPSGAIVTVIYDGTRFQVVVGIVSNLGTPISGTLTNCTGLPIITGVSGLGTGVATGLANNVTGSGSPVLATSPTLVTPLLGTPTSGVLTNCTGSPSLVGTNFTGTAAGLSIGGNAATATKLVLQYAFNARVTSNITSLASSSPIIFDSVTDQSGSAYSASTGLFTAPITGWYLFSASAFFQITSPANNSANIVKNGATVLARAGLFLTSTNQSPSLSMSVVAKLTVGDTVGVYPNSNLTATNYISPGETAFSGMFIGS